LTLVQCPRCGAAFYDDLTPARYEEDHSPGPLKFHVEQGAGVDAMLAPLFRFPPDRVRKYLEVGCGFGYALDFARFAFGWQVLGIDPSVIAAAGREALKLEIVPAYLSDDTDLGGATFDLILCSELIEHVPNPHRFLRSVQRRLATRGALTLTTPNAAAIRAETPSGILLSILDPGRHVILFSKASLEYALKANGFAHVQIWEYAHTLHAVASRHRYPVPESATLDRALYRRYLTDRSTATPAETPLGLGFAYRLFKECVNAGDFTAAEPVFEHLRAACATVYDLDVSVPGSIVPDAQIARDFDLFARTHPFNLTGVLYFRAILEVTHRLEPEIALRYFQAAARAGVAVRTALRSIGADDAETERLVALARVHSVYCRARLDPAAAVSELDVLGSDPGLDDPPPEVWRVPPEMVSAARADLFVCLVNAGRYAEAAHLADAVSAALGVTAESLSPPMTAPLEADSDIVLNSLFCLGMLALNHQVRFERAAAFFGLAHRFARAAYSARRPSHVAASLIWPARYHEALALQRAGEQSACEVVVRSVIEERNRKLPEVDPTVLDALRRLIS
jgi:SAM-dependent methyltransferase